MVSLMRIDVARHFRLRELYCDQNKIQSLVIDRASSSTSAANKSQESQLRTLNLSWNHIGKYEGYI